MQNIESNLSSIIVVAAEKLSGGLLLTYRKNALTV